MSFVGWTVEKHAFVCLVFQKQDIMQNSLSIYGNEGVCNGGVSAKLGCVSPSEHLSKRAKIS